PPYTVFVLTIGIYWPNPELQAWGNGRDAYESRRIATLDSSGQFTSTDDLLFNTSDVGDQPLRRKCSCLPNHKRINYTDWSYGCEPEFKSSLCGNGEDHYLHLAHFDFWGYDFVYMPNTTLSACKQECNNRCTCKGFQFKYDWTKGFSICYPKFLLVNGYGSSNFNGSMYLKVPKNIPLYSNNNKAVNDFNLNCSNKPTIQLDRPYDLKRPKESIKFLMLSAYVFGALEIVFVIYFFYGTRSRRSTTQGYLQTATGFKRFGYSELKKASNNFNEEIGRGGGGIVYKGVLSDNRVVAIKRLNECSKKQGEAELQAEISTLGTLNHMKLIKMWGYCAESHNRLLVYDYMVNGSLAQNLHCIELDWDKNYEIALGTAKGLAYLHEECLEWILHCDVKPQNILLDCDYKPKVADFGLSRLLDRDETRNLEFTKARGTRGYMAPEWLFVNIPITSKVDVYRYGVVMLEMITGQSPTGANQSEGSEVRLHSRVAEKITAAGGKNDWVHEVIDLKVDENYSKSILGTLIKVALRCCEEDKDASVGKILVKNVFSLNLNINNY
ncbi:putative receptor protein kinase ZmPK1, partial [Tanacetum coccineum]